MASEVAICNLALSLLGADQAIASISPPDGSAEAGYCKTFYPLARNLALELCDWKAAKARVALAETDNPSTVWAYAYQLPSDCLKPLRILSSVGSTALLFSEQQTFQQVVVDEETSAPYQQEGLLLLTNEPEAVLVYKRLITDTSLYSPRLVSAMSMLLAGYLAGPVIKGLEGARVGAQWAKAGRDEAAAAAADDGNRVRQADTYVASSISARA